jgi:hypothetical protein
MELFPLCIQVFIGPTLISIQNVILPYKTITNEVITFLFGWKKKVFSLVQKWGTIY